MQIGRLGLVRIYSKSWEVQISRVDPKSLQILESNFNWFDLFGLGILEIHLS